MKMPVYKILTLAQLAEFCAREKFCGGEGALIHLYANREQYLLVGQRHYFDTRRESVLVKLNAMSLDLDYVNGFPYQKGEILWSDVMHITPLNLIRNEPDRA